MKLNCRLLKNVNNVNSMSCASTWSLSQDCENQVGETANLYFQVVDEDQGCEDCPAPRFIPLGTTIVMTVSLPNRPDPIVITATQPFAQDASIFMIAVDSTMLPSSGSVLFSLAIDAATYRWRVINGLTVDGDCCC